jgi:hypothetical protein
MDEKVTIQGDFTSAMRREDRHADRHGHACCFDNHHMLHAATRRLSRLHVAVCTWITQARNAISNNSSVLKNA